VTGLEQRGDLPVPDARVLGVVDDGGDEDPHSS
jgi:hypothetical protein